MKPYKRLRVFNAANQLVLLIYRYTKLFPADEKFGLISQIRRAVLSVVLNIIEGYARHTSGDLRRFLDIALGSLAEVEYLLELSVELGYLSQKDYDDAESVRLECGRLLWTYRQKVSGV